MSPATEELIIVLTEHPVLGPLLVPYIATRSDDGKLHLTEQAFHDASLIRRFGEVERAVVEITSHYAEKYLMEVYSSEKVVARFLRNLSAQPDVVKRKIRPFIEKKIREALHLIRVHRLPLYQKQTGSRELYAHHALHVHRQTVQTRFSFRLDETEFRYELEAWCNDAPLSLMAEKPVQVLSVSPAVLLLGMNLYFFEHIESTRLMPFTRKQTVSVDRRQADKYIDNILIPIARYHDIRLEGFHVSEKKHTCEPTLTPEESITGDFCLRVGFRYGDLLLSPDPEEGERCLIERLSSDALSVFRRDRRTEAEALRQLSEWGLQRVSDVLFRLPPDAPERSLREWIDTHRDGLKEKFLLSRNGSERTYCLDEIRIEQDFRETPDWFELHITVAVGDLRIPFSRFRRHILEEQREFILPDGRVLLLPEEWFSRYGNLLEMGVPTKKGYRVKPSAVGAVRSAWGAESAERLPFGGEAPEVPVPPTLKAMLRSYQRKGFAWMERLRKQGFGGCLADDMGLGKTLQTLTLLQHLYRPHSPATVDAPNEGHGIPASADGQLSLFDTANVSASVSSSQSLEERRPATLIVVPASLLHNWQREARRFTTLSMAEYHTSTRVPRNRPECYFDHYHLIFTTYGMLRSRIDVLSAYRFEYVVLDESQHIKNSESLTFQAAVRLQSRHRLALTGTPVENSLKDLWAQFRFLQPDLLGEERSFQKQFLHPIRQGDTRREVLLRQLISPFILRRSKKEVAPELPPLTEETIYCPMPDEQRALYEQEKNSLRNLLLQRTPKAGESRQLFNLLNGILRLRQLACHPRMRFPESTVESGKTEQITDLFETLRSEGHKVLIFSSFVKHLELVADAFRARGWKYALLTGSTHDRPQEIAQFTDQADVQAFLISLKAGGVGLNLTQADYVFIIDPWWNPAAEAQAIARAHRIGQEKQVFAYRFITQESIEEKILLLQEEKRRLAETFVWDSEGIPLLTDAQWAELFR